MKPHILKYIIATLTIIAYCIQIQAQDRLFVYRNTGEVNSFLYSDIKSLECTNIDALGNYHAEYVSQEITTRDSVFRIPLAEIDSISFHAPDIIYKEGVEQLDNIRNYIIYATNDYILLSPSIPNYLIPSVGTKVATITVDDLFPMGYAGEILDIDVREDGCIGLVCTPVGIDEIFYSYYCSFDDFSHNAESVVRKAKDSNFASSFVHFNNISSSFEFELGDETKIMNFPVEISGKLKCGIEMPTLSVKGYDIIVPDRGHVRHVSMSGDFSTEESISVSLTKANKKRDFAFPVIGHFETPLGVPFLAFYYDFGAFYDLKCSVTAGLEFKQNWKLEYSYNSSDNKEPKFSVKQVGSTMSNGPICLKGQVAAGVYGEIGVKPLLIDKDAIGKVSGRFETGIELNGKGYDVNDLLTAGYSTRLYDEIVKDPFVKLDFYESLSATAKLGPVRGTWEIFKGELGTGVTLGAQVPYFSNILCDRVGESDVVRITSEIGNDCILPFKTGFALFDNTNNKISSTYYKDAYYKSNYTSFGVEIENAKKNNKYKAYPIINLLGYEILCNPSIDVKGDFDVVTVGTNSVGRTSAEIVGAVSGEHSEHGMQYRGTSGWISIEASDTKEGSYSITLSGLKEGTEYFYRAYIVVDGEEYYGDTLSFRTGLDEDPTLTPVVITGEYGNLTSTTATIECSYKDIPLEATCGYSLYALSSAFDVGISENNVGRVEGSKTFSLTNLQPATTYCYSGYVYYNGKYYDGKNRYFTTKMPETEASISGITSTSAEIHCTYVDVPEGSKLGFYLWAEDKDFGFIESVDYKIHGLEIGKTYYVKPVVIYADNEYSTNTVTFTTLRPNAITGKVSDITVSSATCFASFENVPDGAECFICLRYSYQGDYTYELMSPQKNVSQAWENLQAGHKYDYWAVIVYDGKEYAGEERSFTTKEHPVELSEFKVTKAEWKRNGFEFNGRNYTFKYNFSLTAKLKDASNVEDWGYVYVDPEGGQAHISLSGKGTSFVDDRYAYCRNEAESSVTLYGYVKYLGADKPVYDDGVIVSLIYSEEPAITFQSVEITGIEATPQYDGDGSYLFTWYTTKFKYIIQINGGYWIDNIQPIVYENGSWSYNGGKVKVPGDGLYSVSSSMSYDDSADMNWSTGYCITLTDGTIIYTSNEIQVGGTPESPTVNVTDALSYKKRAKITNKAAKPLKGNIPKLGEVMIVENP